MSDPLHVHTIDGLSVYVSEVDKGLLLEMPVMISRGFTTICRGDAQSLHDWLGQYLGKVELATKEVADE